MLRKRAHKYKDIEFKSYDFPIQFLISKAWPQQQWEVSSFAPSYVLRKQTKCEFESPRLETTNMDPSGGSSSITIIIIEAQRLDPSSRRTWISAQNHGLKYLGLTNGIVTLMFLNSISIPIPIIVSVEF